MENQLRKPNLNHLLFSIPFICLAALLAPGCTATKNAGIAAGAGAKEAAQQAGDTATDASITAAIKMGIADDPVVSAMKINVDTNDGNVTLNGTVQNAAEEDQAVDLARSVDGVKSVVPSSSCGGRNEPRPSAAGITEPP